LNGKARASTPDVSGDDMARPLNAPNGLAGGNILERMRHDLLRALKKPVSERKWIMIIDQQKCIGCCACNLSCNAENNLPPGVVYRPVLRQEVGKYPNVARIFTPKPCMHCDNPPCVPVCPVKATWKREDGTVVVDYETCIGCRNCLEACPYNARTADFGGFYGMGTPEIMPYETRPNYEYSKEWRRKPHSDDSPVGNARKCQFCLHRLREGMLPACVTTCLGGATYFGDYNDKSSLVHKLLGSSRVRQLKPELGTQPSVFYLV
jgi:molybdopterin-containing oxidoreductase family iron-sulfur binding subunit